MKKIISTTFLIIFGVFLSACSKSNPVNRNETPLVSQPTQKQEKKIPDDKQKNQPNANQPKSDEKVYKNEQYGFQLTFPAGWEKYVTEVTDVNSEDCIDCTNVYFSLPHPENFDPISVFAISIKDLNSWNKYQQRCKTEPDPGCSNAEGFLGKNEKYAFDYFPSQDQFPLNLSLDFIQANFKIIPLSNAPVNSSSNTPE